MSGNMPDYRRLRLQKMSFASPDRIYRSFVNAVRPGFVVIGPDGQPGERHDRSQVRPDD